MRPHAYQSDYVFADRGDSVVTVEASHIKAARAIIGMRQQKLAELAGVSQPTMSMIEAGLANPKAATLYKLIRALEAGGAVFHHGGVTRRSDVEKSAAA
jgi:predicted transcriptional regulator